MDDVQKWSSFGERAEQSPMTEDEEKNQKERKARKLQIIVEGADMAIEGNRRLVNKRRAEERNWKSMDERLAFHSGHWKNNLKGSRLAKPSAKDDPSSATHEKRGPYKSPEVTDAAKARLSSE